MATTSKSTAKKSSKAGDTFPDFPAVPDFLSAFTANLPKTPMDACASWWQAYMTGATEMNREFMKFVATRLQHDVELSQSLAKCSDWDAVRSVQGDWVRKMSEAYMGEAKTLMEIASISAQESWTAAATTDAADTDSPASESN